MDRAKRIIQLQQQLDNKILVLDGAIGTYLQTLDLAAGDFGGQEFKGFLEMLNLTGPKIVERVHQLYLQSGCDIVETNTFGASPLMLKEWGVQDLCYQINYAAATLARTCAEKYSVLTPQQPRFVAGCMGPTNKSLSMTGGTSFAELLEDSYQQARGLYEGGVDYFLLETGQDTKNIKASLQGLEKFFQEVKERIPIAVSITVGAAGTMLAGQRVEALVASLEHVNLLYLGLNCIAGPDHMSENLRRLGQICPFRVACVPNAGFPDDKGHYFETPEMMESYLKQFMQEGRVNLVGGCCGTHEGHIRQMVELASSYSPRIPPRSYKSHLAGVNYLEIAKNSRPFLVGKSEKNESTLFTPEKIPETLNCLIENIRNQVRKGAQIVHVTSEFSLDEACAYKEFCTTLLSSVRVPFMIDYSSEKRLIQLLNHAQGKSLICPLNVFAEDSLDNFIKGIQLAKKYGAALAVNISPDRPIISFDLLLLLRKYDFRPEDFYWKLTAPPFFRNGDISLGDWFTVFIEKLQSYKSSYRGTNSILDLTQGAADFSAIEKEVILSFLSNYVAHSGDAVDLLIVDMENTRPNSLLSPREMQLLQDILWNWSHEAQATWNNYFEESKTHLKATQIKEPILQRLTKSIRSGVKAELIKDLDEALKEIGPEEILSGPLMKGMEEVGRLFQENQMILAEVLQAAEAMKTAMAYLGPLSDKKQGKGSKKGKVILATVKGDVHDIGKNLVDIILSNNGFEVINLGTKITSDQLISAIQEHQPDMVGLSGLLRKSAEQMALSAQDLSESGIVVPMLVGGAAISRNFVNKKIASVYKGTVVYARNVMDGLELANSVVDQKKFHQLRLKLADERNLLLQSQNEVNKIKIERTERSHEISIIQRPPVPMDFSRHVVKNTPIEVLWNYMNPLMLYGRHLGIKGNLVRLLMNQEFAELKRMPGGEKALGLYEEVEKVKEKYKKTHLQAKGIFQFFPVAAWQNKLLIFKESATDSTSTKILLEEIIFPRQNREEGLCLSDLVRPMDLDQGLTVQDSVCFFIVTVGQGISAEVENLKTAGHYLHSHILSALALESAEGYAEYLHGKIRSLWGFPDSLEMTMMDRFQAKYRGKRYSFGYPACPDLENQKILFKLLQPQKNIGVELTEGFMMDPESSVSALVFSHPQASYFSVGDWENWN